MAEGGVPPEPKANEPEVECDPPKHINTEGLFSMEMIFIRDLLTHVMARRFPWWRFVGRYGGSFIVTPSSLRIRKAIEHYLIKQDINLYFSFARGFTGLPVNYQGFVSMINKVVDKFYPSLKSPIDLLRLIALLAQYAAMAYERGVQMAPYYALGRIHYILNRYMKERNWHPIVLFSWLDGHAEELIHEPPLEPPE